MKTLPLQFAAFARPLVWIAVLLAPLLHAADPVPSSPKPLLWKIHGPTPVHLFGTIHVADPAVLRYGAAVSNALAQSDIVATEIEMDMEQMMKMAATLMGAKKPLKEVLPAGLHARLDKEFRRINPALTLEPFERMHVWAVAATVGLIEQQLKSPGEPLDLVLANRAKAMGKRAVGLETIEEQVGTFDILNEAEQVRMLEQTLDTLEKARKDGREPVKELIAAYLSGDAERLMGKMNEWMETTPAADREKFLRAFLIDRNALMAERLGKLMKENPGKTFFVAVGAAHLPGEQGLLKLLENSTGKPVRVE